MKEPCCRLIIFALEIWVCRNNLVISHILKQISVMNPLDESPKRYLRPMVRSAETPRRLLTLKSVGHLRAAFLFNLLNFQCYELS